MAIREELSLGLSNWKRGMDEARSDVRRFASDTNREMRSVGGRGGGVGSMLAGGVASAGTDVLASLGFAGGVTGLTMAIKGALTQADDLADLTLALNESAEGLQRVDFAAQQAASIGVDQVAKSMMRLERALGDVENAKANEALDNLGLSASRLAAMSLEEKMLALSDAFQKARETGTGMKDIQDLMGRTAADLVPLFEQGGDALRGMFERAPVMAEETVQQMARVNDEIDAMIMKSKTWLANSVGGIVGISQFIKDTGALDGVGGITALLADPRSQIEAALLATAEREQADVIAAANRDEARTTQAENMEKAAAQKAADAENDKSITAADKAEEEILRERKRRADQRERDAEAFEKASFARLDPDGQMKILRDRIAKSLGVDTVGSSADIAAGAQALADQGRFATANNVLGDLAQLEAIAGRQSGSDASGGGAQGSFATLMDQVFGRGTPEQQLDATRRQVTLQEDQVRRLDAIITKMDQPPPRDIFTDFP